MQLIIYVTLFTGYVNVYMIGIKYYVEIKSLNNKTLENFKGFDVSVGFL